jgi:hypothetical protein
VVTLAKTILHTIQGAKVFGGLFLVETQIFFLQVMSLVLRFVLDE